MRPFFSEPPSRTQRLGMLLACCLIAISFGLRYLIKQQAKSHLATNKHWPVWDSLLIAVDAPSTTNDSVFLHPFLFDPNTVSKENLQQMGLRSKLINTWLHYREKGGHFYTPEQVKRLYALRDTEYIQLAPFIRIEHATYQEKRQPIIELNSADTNQLHTLPGIGQKRALAIVHYRNQLGGFYSTNQLMEVWGIDSQVFYKIKPRIRLNKKAIKRLPLLEITWNELKQHPYFSGEFGRQLLAWRKTKNYQIESLYEITEIKSVDSVLFRKIVPYLSLEKKQ